MSKNIKEIIYHELNLDIPMEDFNENFLEYFQPGEYNKSFDRDSYRWWDEMTCVKKIGNKYFSYTWAITTGDMSANEAGWEFDFDSLIEVEPYEETITIIKYKPIK